MLDTLRARIDAERFDSIAFWLEAVAADLGYGGRAAAAGRDRLDR